MAALEMTRMVHDDTPNLPRVNMKPLQDLVRLVSALERIQAGELVPGDPIASRRLADNSGMVMDGLTCHLTNIHLGIKVLLGRIHAGDMGHPDDTDPMAGY